MKGRLQYEKDKSSNVFNDVVLSLCGASPKMGKTKQIII
jgi:hypothetical protein